MYMQVLYRSLLTLILCHAHGDALPARVGAALEAEILKVRSSHFDFCMCRPSGLLVGTQASRRIIFKRNPQHVGSYR